MRRAVAGVVIALIAASSLTGCGSDTKSSPTAVEKTTVQPTAPSAATTKVIDPGPSESALRIAVEQYSKNFLSARAKHAYMQLTRRCRQRMTFNEFEALSVAAKETRGNVEIEKFKAELNGEQARTTYTYPVRAINQTQEPWAWESNSWHNDDC